MTQIEDGAALDAALAGPLFLLFKHSRVCSVSTRAFAEYERFCAEHPDVPSAWLDVRAQRDLSNRVSDATGVKHESPQALLVRDGAIAWSASHFDITCANMAAAL